MSLYTIGEVVYDIVLKNNQPVAGNAGGSMLNTAVSLGRLAAPIHFVGETGSDAIGQNVISFLQENHVSAQFVQQYQGRNTGIALAFLDQQNNASYSFYKDYPNERLTDIEIPFQAGDFVLFGSSFAFNLSVRKWLMETLQKARTAGATVIYDPNYRLQKHLSSDEQRTMFIENCSLAHIIRASQEDFDVLWTRQQASQAWKLIQSFANCKALVYTKNSEGVQLFTNELSLEFQSQTITPVSTIGAGDTFNAAILWQLWKKQTLPSTITNLKTNDWIEIINTAILCATDVCLHWENYISLNCANAIR